MVAVHCGVAEEYMGRGRQLGWMAAAAMSAACATSAITDDPTLDWDGNPSIPAAGDAGGAGDAGADDVGEEDAGEEDAAPSEVEPDAALEEPADAGEEDPPENDGGLDAGLSGNGSADAATADAGRDAGRDASTPDASTQPDATVDAGPPACPSGTDRCGSECVDTSSESNHCGDCDTVCSTAQVCTAGSCVDPAPTASNCTSKTYGGHNYLFCTGRSDDWVDARRQCINLRMDLGVPDNQAEQDFFKANQGGKALWIGVNDRQTEGEFHAVRFGSANSDTGAQPSFRPWASGEPNNDKNCVILGILCTSDEDCAQLRSQDGLWNDSTCSNTSSYVCESY
jgi:Lectin C-type domain/Stigma-specific protein, Stig1